MARSLGREAATLIAQSVGTRAHPGDFLDALKSGKWDRADSDPRRRTDQRLPLVSDSYQALGQYRRTDLPPCRQTSRRRRVGFRHSDKRLTFYLRHRRQGRLHSKTAIADHAQAEVPDSQYWEIPMFDEDTPRHAFTKVGQKTPKKDLEAMKAVREEDLAHDR